MTNSPPPSLFPENPYAGTACIANISPAERQKRLRFGLMQLGFALALLCGLFLLHADRWWRLPLFLPLTLAAVGFFQWRDKT